MFTRIPILAVLFNLVNPMVTRITFSIRYGMTLIFLLLCSNANAAVLDWNSVVWPDGSQQNTFTDVGSSGIAHVSSRGGVSSRSASPARSCAERDEPENQRCPAERRQERDGWRR